MTTTTISSTERSIEYVDDGRFEDVKVYVDDYLVAYVEPGSFNHNHDFRRNPWGNGYLVEFVPGSKWEGQSAWFGWSVPHCLASRGTAMKRAKAWIERVIQAG